MKKIAIILASTFLLLLINCNAGNPGDEKKQIIHLTNETFKQKVYNYEVNKQWKYEGNLPAIIDFYADWCGPCRKLAPVIEEIAKEYNGKIVIYKVDTDKEKLLSQNLGITSLPTLLFIPVKGQPQAAMGALPKETLVKAIHEILINK
jgi:thioredoxin 1